MNAYAPQKILEKTNTCVFPVENTTPQGEVTRTPSLTEVTAIAKFSHLAAHLHKSIAFLSHEDAHLLETLQDNIYLLQDSFLETLSDILEKTKIDITKKITLRLNPHGVLVMAQEHPHQQIIETILEQHAELSIAFQEIAMQSETLRSIHNLYSMLCTAAEQNTPLPRDYIRPYQLCIKGQMSHFYFKVE